MDKSSPTTSLDEVGDTISYSYLLTNSGEVTVSSIVVTQSDLDATQVVNTASAAGTFLTSGEVASNTDNVMIGGIFPDISVDPTS